MFNALLLFGNPDYTVYFDMILSESPILILILILLLVVDEMRYIFHFIPTFSYCSFQVQCISTQYIALYFPITAC